MNLATLLARTARLSPDAPALGDGVSRVTYRDLDQRVSRLADGLLRAGLASGDRVAILMANRPELLETLYACFRAGLVAVPINSRLHPDEVRFIVSHADARAIVAGPEHGAIARDCDLSLVIGHGAEYEGLIANGDPRFADQIVSGETPAWLFYTSGTTGRPKEATLSHGNLVEMILSCLANVTDYRASDTVLHAAPLTHGAGLYALAGITRGAFHLVPPTQPFDPVEVLETVIRMQVTVESFLTPTMVRATCRRRRRGLVRYPVASIGRLRRRSDVCGGSPTRAGHVRHDPDADIRSRRDADDGDVPSGIHAGPRGHPACVGRHGPSECRAASSRSGRSGGAAWQRDARVRADDPLFSGPGGQRLVARGLYQLVHRLAARAELQTHCSPHVLRHTFARAFLMNGSDVFSLQRILGHSPSSIQVTRRYVELRDDDLRAVD